MNHDHACACSGCSEMGAMLARDPVELLTRARRDADSFAFGVMLRADHECQGVKLYPPKYLPQSNPVDFNRSLAERLTRHGYKYA